jgi:hypothetical protein
MRVVATSIALDDPRNCYMLMCRKRFHLFLSDVEIFARWEYLASHSA